MDECIHLLFIAQLPPSKSLLSTTHAPLTHHTPTSAPDEDEQMRANSPEVDDDVTPPMQIRNTEMQQMMRRRSFQRRSSLADVIPEWPTLGVIDKPQFLLKVMTSHYMVTKE